MKIQYHKKEKLKKVQEVLLRSKLVAVCFRTSNHPKMPKNNPLIMRIVVNGSPSENKSGARKMLLQAFTNDSRRGKSAFAVTPGGFIQARFPNKYGGNRGWDSSPSDFRKLVPFAQKAVEEVVTAEVLSMARRHADFLTIGVDLNYDRGKHKMDGVFRGTHAELIAIVNTSSGEITHWTGKSYSMSSQEKMLVHETDLKSHLFCCGAKRVLILGCHDLNMFSARARANQKPDGPRRKRCDRMRKLVKKFGPNIVLHHPHSTDSPKIWSTAWNGISEFLPRRRNGQIHFYASGIAYHRGSETVRRKLCDVLVGTRCCDSHVLDVVVKGS